MNSIRINRVRAMSEEFARDKGGIAANVWRYCTSGTDGVLTKERMAWLTRIMRDAKRRNLPGRIPFRGRRRPPLGGILPFYLGPPVISRIRSSRL